MKGSRMNLCYILDWSYLIAKARIVTSTYWRDVSHLNGYQVSFGTLSQTNAMSGMDPNTAEEVTSRGLWYVIFISSSLAVNSWCLILLSRTGNFSEYVQPAITKSVYQERLELEDLDASFDTSHNHEESHPLFPADTIRYWSDYNRLFYLPRSVQKVPDLADWDSADRSWDEGKDLFEKFNDVRIFLCSSSVI